MKRKLSKDQIKEVQNSYERCLSSGDFITSFYDEFLGSHPEVAEKFKDTDFTSHYKMIRRGISAVIMFSEGKTSGKAGLEMIRKSHSDTGLDIDSKFFNVWKKALLTTVAYYDGKYDTDIKKSWSKVMDFGIKFILEKNGSS